MNPEQTGLSIEQTIGILRRRGLWILSCVVLVAALAYGLSKHQTKRYTATSAVAFNNNPLSQEIAGFSSSFGSSNSGVLSQLDSNLELVKLGDMAAKTAGLLRHGLTEEEVNSSLSISTRGESSVVDVSATSTSPKLAAAIANTYVNQFVREQQTSNRKFFRSALALVNNQLERLSPAQRFGADGLDLQTRAHALSLLAELGYDNAQVAQEAVVPTSPSSPKVSRNTGLGIVLGLLLGIGIVFLLERIDRRIMRAGELEEVYDLPLLGHVPKSVALARPARSNKDGIGVLRPAEAEAFSLIRARLRFFNVKRDIHTVAVASPTADDGKTTIALHLAEAAARSGSRSLLIETDLRHPTIAQRLGIQAGPGLTDVLIGAVAPIQATQSIDVRTARGRASGARMLDILTAGSVLPPNPGEMLESQTMYALLEQMRATYDLVVLDTAPLAAVSDAFCLLTSVDGVIVVGWVGRSRRDAAEELHKVLASSGASLLGVVANGTKTKDAHLYAGPQPDNDDPTFTSSPSAPSSAELAQTAKS